MSQSKCSACGTPNGPFVRRFWIPATQEYLDFPGTRVCGIPRRQQRDLKPDDRRKMIEQRVNECNSRRAKRDAGNVS